MLSVVGAHSNQSMLFRVGFGLPLFLLLMTGMLGTFVSMDREDELALPPDALNAAAGDYFAAQIVSVNDPGMSVMAYLRKSGKDGNDLSGFEIVGIDRNWPGKLIVEPRAEVGVTVASSRFSSLDEPRKALLVTPSPGETVATNCIIERVSAIARSNYG